MIRHSGLLPAAFCLLLLVLAVPKLDAARDSSTALPYSKTTAHYVVQSDIGDEAAKRIADEMEAMYAYYLKVFEGVRGGVRSRFNVVVFKGQADYVKFVGQRYAGTCGLYSTGRATLASYLYTHLLEDIFPTLYHEGFHQFFSAYVASSAPPWINEGLAELFGHAIHLGRKFRLGEVPPMQLKFLQDALKDGKQIPIEDLMISMSAQDWNSILSTKDDKRALIQYTEAWLLCHYLVFGGKERYRLALNTYINLIRDGAGNRMAFLRAFAGRKGADNALADLDRDFREYVLAMKPGPILDQEFNLKLLGNVILFYKKSAPDALADANAFYAAVMQKRLKGWKLEFHDGSRLTSDDLDWLKRCFAVKKGTGAHDERERPGITLVPPASPDGPPDVLCAVENVQLRLKWYKDPAGGKMECDVLRELRE